jgi:hypothetical protein
VPRRVIRAPLRPRSGNAEHVAIPVLPRTAAEVGERGRAGHDLRGGRWPEREHARDGGAVVGRGVGLDGLRGLRHRARAGGEVQLRALDEDLAAVG